MPLGFSSGGSLAHDVLAKVEVPLVDQQLVDLQNKRIVTTVIKLIPAVYKWCKWVQKPSNKFKLTQRNCQLDPFQSMGNVKALGFPERCQGHWQNCFAGGAGAFHPFALRGRVCF